MLYLTQEASINIVNGLRAFLEIFCFLVVLVFLFPPLAVSDLYMSLHPNFPVITDKYQMTERWSLVLPDKYNRRIENESLVIWRPGITLWIDAYNNDQKQTIEERAAWANDIISKETYDIVELSEKNMYRIGYRLSENSEDSRVPGFYGYVIANNGHIQISIYFDKESDAAIAKQIWKSIRED